MQGTELRSMLVSQISQWLTLQQRAAKIVTETQGSPHLGANQQTSMASTGFFVLGKSDAGTVALQLSKGSSGIELWCKDRPATNKDLETAYSRTPEHFNAIEYGRRFIVPIAR